MLSGPNLIVSEMGRPKVKEGSSFATKNDINQTINRINRLKDYNKYVYGMLIRIIYESFSYLREA